MHEDRAVATSSGHSSALDSEWMTGWLKVMQKGMSAGVSARTGNVHNAALVSIFGRALSG